MAETQQNQLIAEVARELVAQHAPQELLLFKAQSAAFFADPEKALAASAEREEVLGFGTGEAVAFLTPVVLAVTSDVVQFLTAELGKSIKAEGSGLIGETVKAMFKKLRPGNAEGQKPEGRNEKNTPPPLTPEQLAQIHRLAIKKARQLKLSESRSKLLADSIVGGLALT